MKQITAVEMIITYISIGWALALFTTPNLFDKSESFAKLESVMGYEWVVGVLALICAGVKLVGMALGNINIRWIGLLMSSVFWIFVAGTFLIAPGKLEINTGFVVYSGIATICLFMSKEVKQGGRNE